MNVESYLRRRREIEAQQPKRRSMCRDCRQPGFSCYCRHLRPFDPILRFVILIHPLEVKRRIATGRMSHQVLSNSELIEGEAYADHPRVIELLTDPTLYPVVLSPGKNALDLSSCGPIEKASLFPNGRMPVIFVIDGTWATARQTLNHSPNLKSLPRICFVPPKPSTFRVRKQPSDLCYSTIEAVHHTIELIGQDAGFDVSSRRHDALLEVFDQMVTQQLAFIPLNQKNRRRPKKTLARMAEAAKSAETEATR